MVSENLGTETVGDYLDSFIRWGNPIHCDWHNFLSRGPELYKSMLNRNMRAFILCVLILDATEE